MLAKADLAPGMAVEAAGEVEFEQHHLHRAAGKPRQADDLVDRSRRRAEQFLDSASRDIVGVDRARRATSGSKRARGEATRPASGVSVSITSAALWTKVAPSRISELQPCARGSSGEPGTAITSRPASAASRAVISEPDRGAASTTTVPSDKPGDDPVAIGEMARAAARSPAAFRRAPAPARIIARCRSSFSGG